MDWLRDHPWESWLAASIVLVIAEMFSLDLVLLMMAVGAFAGMGLALAGADFAFQALGAAGVALAMLTLVRKPMVQRLHRGPELQLGTTKLLGQRAVVTAEIPLGGLGQIRLDGETWTAATETMSTFGPGDPVEVERIDGATAYVRPATIDSDESKD